MATEFQFFNLSEPIVPKIVKNSIKNLGKRHAVDVKYLLNENIEEQFEKCVKTALSAFLGRIKRYKRFQEEDAAIYEAYLKTNLVSEEISKLFDPGIEIFDVDLLAECFRKLASEKMFKNFHKKNITKAWNEFLLAFSFASRLTPDLREFLRASYEVGSFRELADVHDDLDQLWNTLEAMKQEEQRLKHQFHLYKADLSYYRNWAEGFLSSI